MKQLVFESELREPIIRVVIESTVVTPWKTERSFLVDSLENSWPTFLLVSLLSIAGQRKHITSYQIQILHHSNWDAFVSVSATVFTQALLAFGSLAPTGNWLSSFSCFQLKNPPVLLPPKHITKIVCFVLYFLRWISWEPWPHTALQVGTSPWHGISSTPTQLRPKEQQKASRPFIPEQVAQEKYIYPAFKSSYTCLYLLHSSGKNSPMQVLAGTESSVIQKETQDNITSRVEGT